MAVFEADPQVTNFEVFVERVKAFTSWTLEHVFAPHHVEAPKVASEHFGNSQKHYPDLGLPEDVRG